MLSAESRVLLIDDDDLDREAVSRLLQSRCTLVEAKTGSEGLDVARQEPPDCALLDYRLPDVNGLDVLDQLVEQGIPVIMLTGHGSEDAAVEAMKRGAADYLPKSRTHDQEILVRAISNALERSALRRELDDKQQELEAFVSTAAHDLRGPLNTISLAVHLMRKSHEQGNSAVFDAAAERALSVLEDARHLLDGLLQYTRRGRGGKPLERVNLNDSLRQALSALEGAIQTSHAQIDWGELPVVEGDTVALAQLLQNLVANAIKFRGSERPVIEIVSRREHDVWKISVTDHGIGFDPSQAERIFLPLTRLSNQSEADGIGLGLATCAKIARQHGGRIWAESEPGRGSTFHLTLPAGDDPDMTLRPVVEVSHFRPKPLCVKPR
jgi:signal transduction histidine kinase